ncbi:TolC family protein [Lacisediminimonas profundi]|uniref:TolC family protein n=1 Tax=Lacisediminimonas profundi TaxID=2603856 RepID=UPI00124AEA3B|nr:TolC family protein [Lacisediminimonas profundi]
MKRFRLASILAVLGSIVVAEVPAQVAGRAPAPAPASLALATKVSRPGGVTQSGAKSEADTDAAEPVSLKAFAGLIAVADESVLIQRYEAAIAEHGVKGAAAIFEPSFFATSELESSRMQNSSSEILQRAGTADYASRIGQLKSGINLKTATGADVEFSYNVSRSTNSLQAGIGITGPEYRSNLGAKLTQPLLRGGGIAATNAAIRIAEREQMVAREMLRQVVSQRVMDGVSAYFNVQRARERARLRTEASAIAERLLAEVRRQQERGLKSAFDVQDMESTAAQRRSQLAQAQQDYEEQLNTFRAMIAARERDSGSSLRARRTVPSDPVVMLAPAPVSAPGSGVQGEASSLSPLELSLSRRPELRVNRLKEEREDIRVEFARNQLLPELSLSLRYGVDDLARYYRAPNDYLFTGSPYNTWSVGLQFRYFLQGDQKRSSEYETAAVRRQQAGLAKSAVEQRIANEVESSMAVLDKGLQQVARQQENARAQRELLRIDEGLVREGRKSALDLMKRQLDLLVAEEALADSIVIANRASFMVSQVQGNVLVRLGLEQ